MVREITNSNDTSWLASTRRSVSRGAAWKTARESVRFYNLPGIPRAGPVVNIETNRITHFTVMVLELLAMLIGPINEKRGNKYCKTPNWLAADKLSIYKVRKSRIGEHQTQIKNRSVVAGRGIWARDFQITSPRRFWPFQCSNNTWSLKFDWFEFDGNRNSSPSSVPSHRVVLHFQPQHSEQATRQSAVAIKPGRWN